MAGAEHRGSSGELRKEVTWFGPVVDHAIDALFVQDDHGAIVDVNRQACESLGYAPEDIIGSTPARVMTSQRETLSSSPAGGLIVLSA